MNLKKNVSRGTFPELEEFRTLILKKNKEINLISSSTEDNSRERHIIDSAQIIDFIDKNCKFCTDLGSGSGLPGIVLAIIMKHKKSNMKFKLYEKNHHKSTFLNEVTKRFNLNVEVIKRDIFQEENLVSDIIVARAYNSSHQMLILEEAGHMIKENNIKLIISDSGSFCEFAIHKIPAVNSMAQTTPKIRALLNCFAAMGEPSFTNHPLRASNKKVLVQTDISTSHPCAVITRLSA